MGKKTPLMEQYEKEFSGKHAIWAGRITNQFKEWVRGKEKEEYIKPIEKETANFEIVLFLGLSKIKNPTFSNIIDFCSSFGMKTNDILQTMIKKIKEGDLAYDPPEDSELINVYSALFNLKKIESPLTIKINEAYNIFNDLNFNKPVDIIQFFKKLHKKYPNFVVLSSSTFDKREDLITFKRLFPNQIMFKLANRWAI
jgi:hypothetical protein